MEIPMLSVDLIKMLREQYPHRHPAKTTPDREVWWNAGASSVVDMLEASLKRQEENPQDTKVIKRS